MFTSHRYRSARSSKQTKREIRPPLPNSLLRKLTVDLKTFRWTPVHFKSTNNSPVSTSTGNSQFRKIYYNHNLCMFIHRNTWNSDRILLQTYPSPFWSSVPPATDAFAFSQLTTTTAAAERVGSWIGHRQQLNEILVFVRLKIHFTKQKSPWVIRFVGPSFHFEKQHSFIEYVGKIEVRRFRVAASYRPRRSVSCQFRTL